jgi:uncharacterized membrane-anchored protein YhcB (DUF1043 family)
MKETLLTIDQAVLLAIISGIIIGALIALISTKSAVKTYKAEQSKKWSDLINMAMTNAYSAGYADGKSKGKPRPSGNVN